MSQAEQIVSGVYRVADGIVNWYVIEDGGSLTLVDAGWPRSWSKIKSVLAELGRTPADLSAIVLTHAHPDHLGAAERVRRETHAAVYVHAPELPRAHGQAKGSSPLTHIPSLLPTLWRPSANAFVLEATLRGFMFPTWLSDVRPFDASTPLDVPGRPRAVWTPGHTEGHVVIVLEDRGVVFTGDALVTLNVLTRARGPQLMPDQLNGDPQRTRTALDTVATVSADIILPGHGDPFRGSPAEAVQRAREAD